MLDGWREEANTVEILDGECEAADGRVPHSAAIRELRGVQVVALARGGYRRPEARLCNAIHIWYKIRVACGLDESKSTNRI